MAALVCDICGGKLIMSSGSIAVCDSCGMEHSKERMQEKVQEIRGVVRVDNSHMIENYLSMAQNAYDSENQAEAESYCNKILEIDPNNHHAWLIKGKSAGWQSTLQSPRFSEAVSGFSKAIVNAPEDEKNDIMEETKDEIKKLASALISLRSDRFAKWPDEDEANGFISDLVSIINAITQYITQSGNTITVTEIMSPIASQIDQAVVAAWNEKIKPDYIGDRNDHALRTFIERIGYCTTLLEKAISLCDEDDEDDVLRYEFLIHLHSAAIDSCSWDYSVSSSGIRFEKTLLTIDRKEAIQMWRNLILQYEAKVAAIKGEKDAKEKAEADARFKKYWEDHADEKFKLETELLNLTQQISALDTEINNVPGEAEVSNIQGRISKLRADRDALSFFEGKKKKAIQEQIDTATAELESVTARRRASISLLVRKVTPLEIRKSAINEELTKAR